MIYFPDLPIETLKKETIKEIYEFKSGGYEQVRPKYTRARKSFTLSLNLRLEDEDTLDLFFTDYQGEDFYFKEPTTKNIFLVRFNQESISFDRQAGYITSSCEVKLREV